MAREMGDEVIETPKTREELGDLLEAVLAPEICGGGEEMDETGRKIAGQYVGLFFHLLDENGLAIVPKEPTGRMIYAVRTCDAPLTEGKLRAAIAASPFAPTDGE